MTSRRHMAGHPMLWLIAGLMSLAAMPGFAQSGEKLFRKCAACHAVGEGAGMKVGPHLNNLFGRTAGGIDGYRYSKPMRAAGEGGLVWTDATLAEYLKAPRTYIKGTRMNFVGFKKQADLTAMIAYLRKFSGSASASPVPNKTVMLGAAAASLEGDAEYGEYLSGECVTCHQASGKAEGIPAIVGWPPDLFIHALYEYKTKIRKNPVMQTISGRLSDEEMAALAAYFGTLETATIMGGEQ